MAAMTTLETAMKMLVKVFETYSKADGDKDTLTKAELKKLLEKELPFLQECKAAEDMMDANGDKRVDFQEFLVFVAALTTCMRR